MIDLLILLLTTVHGYSNGVIPLPTGIRTHTAGLECVAAGGVLVIVVPSGATEAQFNEGFCFDVGPMRAVIPPKPVVTAP